MRAHCSATSSGLAGMQRGGFVHRRLGDHHEHQLGAVFIAVDHRRRVFRLWRDEGDAGGHLGRAAITMHADGSADLQLAHHRFGHEEAHLDVFRRKYLRRWDCRPPPIRLRDTACRRPDRCGGRRFAFCCSFHVACGQRCPVGRNLVGLGFHLLVATGQGGYGEVAFDTGAQAATSASTAARASIRSVMARCRRRRTVIRSS